MVRLLLTNSSPVVSVIVPVTLKSIVSPAFASMIACLSESAPLSLVFITVIVAALTRFVAVITAKRYRRYDHHRYCQQYSLPRRVHSDTLFPSLKTKYVWAKRLIDSTPGLVLFGSHAGPLQTHGCGRFLCLSCSTHRVNLGCGDNPTGRSYAKTPWGRTMLRVEPE